MARYSAIADVGDTLVELLQTNMADLIDDNEVGLASPDDMGSGNDFRLTLYLFDVTESPHHKTTDPPPTTHDRTLGSPLVLDLHYLLTAHPSRTGPDGTAKSREQHSVLGRAMQVLHDNAIVRGSVLKGSLAGEEPLHISIDPDATEEIVNIWSTFDEKQYRPSVPYLVTPVVIESTRDTDTHRVLERGVVKYTHEQAAPDD